MAQNSTARPQSQENPHKTQATNPPQAKVEEARIQAAKGELGYSNADQIALVDAVQQILPLGANEWKKVQSIYNSYASLNRRSLRLEVESLKTKFRGLIKYLKQ
ncbi:hypothetical protein PtA15_6A850 [Puccinia triticina]|uniref:Uncharacterized protein n=1 Tax=Puccinia triticina TaxID=208348 RepID=A0ABY7CPF0_9BASI|nr:uncharacterized protein PtA15_6A850 [Puccinia triticina]WAQ86218.1 hypothetical protein PtA15_6A850 [Puccinia triticina]